MERTGLEKGVLRLSGLRHTVSQKLRATPLYVESLMLMLGGEGVR